MMRIATLDDLEDVTATVFWFLANESPFPSPEFSKVEAVCRGMLMSPNDEKIVLVEEAKGTIAGILMGFVEANLWNDQKTAYEMAWWVHPDHRGSRIGIDLLKAFEYWGQKMGATSIHMSNISNDSYEKVDKLYQRTGYKPVEHSYIKRI